MPLDSYTGLLATVADWLNRRDLTDTIPDFVRLAEDDMAHRLRDRRQESYADATIAGQPVQLPSDWLEVVRITATGSGRPILPASLQQIQAYRADRTLYGVTLPPLPDPLNTGMRYATSGSVLEVWPMPQGPLQLSMIYRARVPRLSPTVQTTWLLQEDPAVYLFGALAMSEPYLRNDERVQTWASMYMDRVKIRNEASEAGRYAGGSLRRTRRGFR